MDDQASQAALPAAVQLLGNLVKFRLRGADTGNAYSLVEVVSAPGALTARPCCKRWLTGSRSPERPGRRARSARPRAGRCSIVGGCVV